MKFSLAVFICASPKVCLRSVCLFPCDGRATVVKLLLQTRTSGSKNVSLT